MKLLILIILLVSFTSCVSTKIFIPFNINTVASINGRHYKIDTLLFRDKQLAYIICQYKNDSIKHGKSVSIITKNKCIDCNFMLYVGAKGRYKNNKKRGLWVYYDEKGTYTWTYYRRKKAINSKVINASKL